MVADFADGVRPRRARPDLVRQTLDKARRRLGGGETVRRRLAEPMAWIFSSGTVVEIGMGLMIYGRATAARTAAATLSMDTCRRPRLLVARCGKSASSAVRSPPGCDCPAWASPKSGSAMRGGDRARPDRSTGRWPGTAPGHRCWGSTCGRSRAGRADGARASSASEAQVATASGGRRRCCPHPADTSDNDPVQLAGDRRDRAKSLLPAPWDGLAEVSLTTKELPYRPRLRAGSLRRRLLKEAVSTTRSAMCADGRTQPVAVVI
jgi:hypothetical protein